MGVDADYLIVLFGGRALVYQHRAGGYDRAGRRISRVIAIIGLIS